MRAFKRYLQATYVEDVESALALIESLPSSIGTRNRLSVFCTRSTAERILEHVGCQPEVHGSRNDLLVELNRMLLGRFDVSGCHQRLSALGDEVFVIGSLASGAVTGAMSMFLLHHGLERATAREHERSIADGKLLLTISGSTDDVAVYEMRNSARSSIDS